MRTAEQTPRHTWGIELGLPKETDRFMVGGSARPHADGSALADGLSMQALAWKLQGNMAAPSLIEVVQEAIDPTKMTDVPVEDRVSPLSTCVFWTPGVQSMSESRASNRLSSSAVKSLFGVRVPERSGCFTIVARGR